MSTKTRFEKEVKRNSEMAYTLYNLPGVCGPVYTESVIKEACVSSMNSEGCKLFTIVRSIPNLELLSMSNSYEPLKKGIKITLTNSLHFTSGYTIERSYTRYISTMQTDVKIM